MGDDIIHELREHLREVADDRDLIIVQRNELRALTREARAWLDAHAHHPPTCALVGTQEGGCTCGLTNLKTRLS